MQNITRETIEQFVLGKLPQDQVLDFEQEMQRNPDLKMEVDLQNEIREALIESRKKDLKLMLQAVAVSSVPTLYTWIRYGAVTTGLGLGIWFGVVNYFSKEKPQQVVSVNVIKENKQEELVKPLEVEPIKETIEEEKIAKVSVNKPNLRKKKETKEEDAMPIIVEENNHSEHLPSTLKQNEIHQIPHGDIALTIKEEFVKDVSLVFDKNKFDYQFKKDKLILVGDFSKGTYEILELNKNQKRSIYLYFEKEFYELKESATELTPLEKLENSSIKKELINKLK